MPIQSLETLGVDILQLEDHTSLENFDFTIKGFPISLDNSNQLDVNFTCNKTDLTMNGATSDQSLVKSETANFEQCQEFNPFLSNVKVSNLAQLMASQFDQGSELEIETSSFTASSPMSTTYSSEPSSPFSIYSISTTVSPMEEDASHLAFDEDTISSLASIFEEDSNNNDRGFWEEEPKAKVQRTSYAQLSPTYVGQVPRSPAEGFDFGPVASNPGFMCTNFTADPSTEKANLPVLSERPNTTSTKQSCQRKSTKSHTRKPPNLNLSFPSKDVGAELSILVQPEKHHRARYLTEGSRGSVKDDSQQSFPTLKLHGVKEGVTLHVFVASDQGKIKPHGYYQACKVTGRNTTPCKEIDVDGTTVIEIPWECADKMEMSVDCVGILKLRNADVEQRIGLARSKRKSTTVRLVFRVFIEQPSGSVITLQQISSPICCTQPLGHPEIIKKSIMSCSVKGDEELFIIGKNFIAKHTKVKLQELCPMGKVMWEGNCEIDRSLFHNTHIVCKIPPYKTSSIDRPTEVYLVVSSGTNKSSELYAHPINYMPSSEPGKKTECIPVHHPVLEITEPSVAAVTTTPMQSIPQSPSCKLDGGTSFADTLKAAAHLELNHPGLLAKLALQETNVATLMVSSVLSL